MERVPLERLAKHFRVSIADAEAAQADLGFLYRELANGSGGWQPIETAPKDASNCLVCSISGVGEAWFSADDDRWYWACGDRVLGQLTHWQPLPAPPVEAKSEVVG